MLLPPTYTHFYLFINQSALFCLRFLIKHAPAFKTLYHIPAAFGTHLCILLTFLTLFVQHQLCVYPLQSVLLCSVSSTVFILFAVTPPCFIMSPCAVITLMFAQRSRAQSNLLCQAVLRRNKVPSVSPLFSLFFRLTKLFS